MRTAAAILFLAGWTTALELGAAPLSELEQSWLRTANRHEKGGWIYLHVEGGPAERGFQHGYLLAKEIAEGVRVTRVSWEYQSGMSWDWLVGQAGAMFGPKIDAENLAEIEGLVAGLKAAGIDLRRDDLIAYNGSIELSGYWWPQHLKQLKEAPPPPVVRESCSSFIATGAMTKDGNVVLGHNTMSGYSDAFANVIIDLQPEHGHRILMQTVPGWIHSGTDFFITDAGLVGSETTIGGFDGFSTNGIPEFSRMRRATQDADSIDGWCSIVQIGNNGGYANAWLLGDVRSHEIARLELGLKRVQLEKKRDGWFIGSNVAEDLKLLRLETNTRDTDVRTSAIARRVRWKALMATASGRIDVELAKRFEADHFDVYLNKVKPDGRTLCGHAELEGEPAGAWPGVPFGCAGTIDGKVVDSTMARRMSFAARWGSACGKAFEASKYLSDHPQFEWMQGILKSRPSQPWVVFTAGEPR